MGVSHEPLISRFLRNAPFARLAWLIKRLSWRIAYIDLRYTNHANRPSLQLELFCDHLKEFLDNTGKNLELRRYLPSTHFNLITYVNFQEAQRIFPSVPHFARKTTEDCQLGK